MINRLFSVCQWPLQLRKGLPGPENSAALLKPALFLCFDEYMFMCYYCYYFPAALDVLNKRFGAQKGRDACS